MLNFEIEIPTGTYLAIGFGESMINTDVVLWQAPADNDATVSDLWSTTYSAPKLDDIQNVKLDF